MADRAVDELSGGELQRVWLAAAWPRTPACCCSTSRRRSSTCATRWRCSTWCATSPTTAASPSGSCCTTSNQAAAVADELVLLDEGRVRAAGPPADVLRRRAAHRDLRHPVEVDHDPRTGASAPARSAGTCPRPYPSREENPMNDPRTVLTALAARLLSRPAAPPSHAAAPPGAGRRRRPHPSPSPTAAARRSPCPAPATRVVGAGVGRRPRTLVTLGVMPVGVADTEGYAQLGQRRPSSTPASRTSAPAASPASTRSSHCSPDLVVMPPTSCRTPRSPSSRSSRRSLVTKGGDAKDNLGQMRSDLELIATAVGKTGRGDRSCSRTFDAEARRRQGGDRRRGRGRQRFAIADG